ATGRSRRAGTGAGGCARPHDRDRAASRRASRRRRARVQGDRPAARLQRRLRTHARPPRAGPARVADGGLRMTDIPFVDRLGDALEAAIAEPLPSRLRLRSRRNVFVLAVFAAAALAVAALAVAHVLSSPDRLATTGIACYASADLSSDVTVVPNDRAPVAACADAFRRLGQSVPPLVACANGSSIAVIRAADRGVCARVGLEPLPPGYALARAKVSLLAEAVRALEARQDCLAPDKLARGVEHLLFVQGWQGWTAEVQSR